MGRKKKGEEVDWKDMPESYEKYQAYLKSQEWKDVRQVVLDRDHHRCRCCGRTEDKETLSVHHSSYRVLYHELEGDNTDWLITLCRICHRGVHSAKSNLGRFKGKPKK